eukprot:symbB.v1.2.019358.t1/scaffold1564.1/size111405/9
MMSGVHKAVVTVPLKCCGLVLGLHPYVPLPFGFWQLPADVAHHAAVDCTWKKFQSHAHVENVPCRTHACWTIRCSLALEVMWCAICFWMGLSFDSFHGNLLKSNVDFLGSAW